MSTLDQSERFLYSASYSSYKGGPVTAGAIVTNGRIVESDPILRGFRGRPVESLAEWVRKMGGTLEIVCPVGPLPRKSHLLS